MTSSNPPLFQGSSLLGVTVASGDALDVRELHVEQQMNALFRVALVALSDNPSLDFDAVVGKEARFVMRTGLRHAEPTRFWSGIVSQLHQIRVEERGLSTYRLTIVPPLWLLTQRRNYRIFQQMSEPAIALSLLGEWGIAPVVKLGGDYPKRKYRVQYAESDYAFLCRMLEDAGISFYFEQGDLETRLVLSDAPQGNDARPPIAFSDEPDRARGEYVTKVTLGKKVRPGRYTVRDHDYRRPATYPMIASAEARGAGVEQQLERYHYAPGAFLFASDKGEDTPFADDKGKVRADETVGAAVAERRLAAKRATGKTASFETNAFDLAPGVVTSILDHPHADLAPTRKLLVVAASLRGTSHGEWYVQCDTRSADAPFRPPVATKKPRIPGVESATVVGPEGEEIHTDEFGRVRVQFHWDRYGQRDDNSSCWMHVSQPWGGAGYGGVNLPRVGQEVLVDFLGGDPDRPVVTGRVYTNLEKVPYGLPANKTQSGWKSNSSPTTGGYNEIMFEDKAGGELVRVQAEKDLHKLVKNDEEVRIGRDRTKQVGHDDSHTVGNDRTHQVGNDETIGVGNDQSKSVGNDETTSVGNNRSKSVGGNEDSTIGQDLSKLVGGNEREVTSGNRSGMVGGNRSTQVGGIDSLMVGDTHSLMISPAGEGGGGATATVHKDGKIQSTTGKATITVDGGKVIIEAEDIVLNATGSVTINGRTIQVEAEAELLLDAGGQAELSGGMDVTVTSESEVTIGGSSGVTVEASGGDVLIQGGPMVLINP
jgi:type VI secretion system secreted protein VgrG